MKDRLDEEAIGRALRGALSRGMIREEDTAVIFHDLDFLESRIRHLVSVFPPGTLHALAIKANPLSGILRFSKDIDPGTGVEAASAGEVSLALRAGYEPGRIVYDSPVKTVADLRFALSHGIWINADNLAELERIREWTLSGSTTLSGSVGLRINPQVGTGTIEESSVAGEYSKFGVPVKLFRREIIAAFLACPWLRGVHLHVGSQGCAMEMLINGIGILYDLVSEINERRTGIGLQPVNVFDIGGGLPISYGAGASAPSMAEYMNRIAARAPKLTDPGRFRLITEFGRWTYTSTGWTVSRVEYVKREPRISTAMIHAGADLFVRECLNPKDWRHEYLVFDREGRQKSGQDPVLYNLAGPLCFSGDIVAKNVPLPVTGPGDLLVIRDTGGYTFSMWSRYNSRQTPRILGYRGNHFEILKERESLEELAGFWD